jgi:hypothetical protein
VLDVLDVTITPVPANRNARLVSVKTASDPEPATELEQLNKQLDALAQPGPLRRAVDPAEVAAFLLEEKQRYVEEALDRAEQAAGAADASQRGPRSRARPGRREDAA